MHGVAASGQNARGASMRAARSQGVGSPVRLYRHGWLARHAESLLTAVLVGGRPVFLVVYATLAPIAIIASAWLSGSTS
jgi:hypothetical protein